MRRFAALKIILECLSENDLLITTTGMISREAFAAKDRPENFYMVGSMGLVTPLALGVALNAPKKKIIGLEGDGSMFLNLGSLVMVGFEKPKNLLTIVLDNGCYESTGGQPCISRRINLSPIAKSGGYLISKEVKTETELKNEMPKILKLKGPNFLLVKVEASREENIPRVSFTPEEIKERFTKSIKK